MQLRYHNQIGVLPNLHTPVLDYDPPLLHPLQQASAVCWGLRLGPLAALTDNSVLEMKERSCLCMILNSSHLSEAAF